MNEPTFDDYVKWIEELVERFGVEIDLFAWYEIRKKLKSIDANEKN